MSWLPPEPSPSAEDLSEWRPIGLALANVSRCVYVVVEELLGRAVSLTLSPWPSVDSKGRLVFPEETREALVDRFELHELLNTWRSYPDVTFAAGLAQDAMRRPVSVGDVFATKTDISRPDLLSLGATELLGGSSIIDVTAQARDAAQASTNAAFAPVLDTEEVERLLDLESHDEVDELDPTERRLADLEPPVGGIDYGEGEGSR